MIEEYAELPSTRDSYELFADALWDFQGGREDGYIEVVNEDLGWRVAIDVWRYFALDEDEQALTLAMLRHAEGEVWDIGAGAGRHALELQRLRREVLAIDANKRCVKLMRARGVRRAMALDARSLLAGSADTLLLLDNGLSLAGTPDGAVELLRHLAERLRPGGCVLVCAVNDVTIEPDASRVHVRYNGVRGHSFSWFCPPSRLLRRIAKDAGFRMAVVWTNSSGRYLAKLSPER